MLDFCTGKPESVAGWLILFSYRLKASYWPWQVVLILVAWQVVLPNFGSQGHNAAKA